MAVKKANPMLTRNGKPRLGPLTITQLKEMASKAQRGKDRARYENRIRVLETKLSKTA
jgi:hypothetical protein